MKKSKWLAWGALASLVGVGLYYRFKRRAAWLLHSPSTSQPHCKTEQCNTEILRISGMKCEDCAKTIQDELMQLDGVCEVKADFESGKVTVCYDPEFVTCDEIESKIQDAGYGIS